MRNATAWLPGIVSIMSTHCSYVPRDLAKSPPAHFVTQAFAKAADGSVEAKGTLTIRGKSTPVTLKVHFAASGNSATLDVDTTLKRLDFGLGVSSDWNDIGKDVPVHGHLQLTAK